MTASSAEKLARYAAAALMVAIISIAGNIQFSVIQSMGWFLGFIGLIALAGEVTYPLFWHLNKIVGGIVLAICLVTSATLELAFYRQELSKLTEARAAAVLKRDRLHKEINELTDRLWVGRERLPEVIQADINRLLARRIRIGGRSTTVALATKDCSPTARLTPRYCSEILKLRTQLAASLGAAEFERKRDQKQKEVDALEVVGDPNPLAGTIAELIRLRWEVSDAIAEISIQVSIIVFIHTILICTSLVCFSSRSSENSPSIEPSSEEILHRSEAQLPGLKPSLSKFSNGRDVAELFLKTRLKASSGDHLDLKPTHDLYRKDCEILRCEPVVLGVFSRMLADRQLHTKKTRGSKTGGTRYWGVTVADG